MSWPRLVAAGVLAGGLTAAAQGPSHAVWIWWVPIVAGLVVLLALSRHVRAGEPVALLSPSEVRT
jgi:FtsH-binding integral membrane protein